jgi:hypothetical protein
MTKVLSIASHRHTVLFWDGGHYELNLSFDTLRDKQWQRVMQTIWDHPSIYGPLAIRYAPGGEVSEPMAAQIPPPTATLTQHGQMKVGQTVVGCDVQATRSLFECVSVLVPLGMFNGIVGGPDVRQQYPELQELDDVLYSVALSVYDVAPFKIAALGYERECQLPAELRSNGELRHNFLVNGNFLAQEDVLLAIEPDLTPYQQVRDNLRWMPPRL